MNRTTHDLSNEEVRERTLYLYSMKYKNKTLFNPYKYVKYKISVMNIMR